MSGRKIKVAFMDAARKFISSLPEKAQKKITYNLLKVEGGEMDKELFKKLESSRYGNFGRILMEHVTVSLPSGTRK